jgi:hypothetical protein
MGGHGSQEPNVRVNIIRLLMTKFPDFASHFSLTLLVNVRGAGSVTEEESKY